MGDFFFKKKISRAASRRRCCFALACHESPFPNPPPPPLPSGSSNNPLRKPLFAICPIPSYTLCPIYAPIPSAHTGGGVRSGCGSSVLLGGGGRGNPPHG